MIRWGLGHLLGSDFASPSALGPSVPAELSCRKQRGGVNGHMAAHSTASRWASSKNRFLDRRICFVQFSCRGTSRGRCGSFRGRN